MKKSGFLSLAGKYNLGSVKFDREKIYDEHLAYDIKRGLYPNLSAGKLKNGKYVFSKKK